MKDLDDLFGDIQNNKLRGKNDQNFGNMKRAARKDPIKYPLSLNHNGKGIINGMAETLVCTSYIQMKTAFSREELGDFGLTFCSVSDPIIERIVKFMDYDKRGRNKKDWDDLRNYFNIPGIGITRIQVLHLAMTGEPAPKTLLEAEHFYSSSLMMGKFVKNPMTTNPWERFGSGATKLSLDDVENSYNSSGFETSLHDIIGELKGRLHFYRNDDGDITHIATKYSYECETHILDCIENPIGSDDSPESSFDDTLGKFNADVDYEFDFTEEQRHAIDGILNSKDRISVITGSGGTGKTVTVRGIIESLHDDMVVSVVAPTGASAKRLEDAGLSECLDRIQLGSVRTIHSYAYSMNSRIMIRDSWENAHDDTTGLFPDILIIDESSMVGNQILNLLLKSTDEFTRIVFVGDPEQLPPVDAGEIFRTLVYTDKCPIYRLTKVLRTSDESMLKFFQEIREGNDIYQDEYPKYFKTALNKQLLKENLDDKISNLFKYDKNWYWNTAIISHRNAVVDYLNHMCYTIITGKSVQEFNDVGNDIMTRVNKKIPWCWKGAKIVLGLNDVVDDVGGNSVRIVNGDVGKVVNVSLLPPRKPWDEYEAEISLSDGRRIVLKDSYEHIRLAYAMTVHKAQGSEYENVVYIHLNSPMETRRLGYTAVTRAKKGLEIHNLNSGFSLKEDSCRKSHLNDMLF